MDQANQQDSSASPATRAAAFSVHIFTAMGAGIALIALLEAVREHWAAMFAWLGAALMIDALDGPIARRLNVARVLPDWSGEMLDLVVDFVTYVFVPAYAITASGLLLPMAAPLLGAGIVVTGALYFADRRMKTSDNHFRGFPALWNARGILSVPAAFAAGACESCDRHSDRPDICAFPCHAPDTRGAPARAHPVVDGPLGGACDHYARQ